MVRHLVVSLAVLVAFMAAATAFETLVDNTVLLQEDTIDTTGDGDQFKQHIIMSGWGSSPFLQANLLSLTKDSTLKTHSSYMSRGPLGIKEGKVNSLTSAKVNIGTLKSSSDDNKIRVVGRLQINGNFVFNRQQEEAKEKEAVLEAIEATNFLETSSIHGSMHDAETMDTMDDMAGFHKQWTLIKSEHFTTSNNGWRVAGTSSPAPLSTCGHGDSFVMTKPTDHSEGVEKVYSELPEHSQLHIRARVHFIDAWKGSVAFMMVDGTVVWLETHGDPDESESGISTCGSGYPHDRLSVPIDVIVPHTARDATVVFGSKAYGDAVDAGENTMAMGVAGVALSLH